MMMTVQDLYPFYPNPPGPGARASAERSTTNIDIRRTASEWDTSR